jgi:hypothetical protein
LEQKGIATAGYVGKFFGGTHLLGQAKVKQLECPVFVKANVGWLDICISVVRMTTVVKCIEIS